MQTRFQAQWLTKGRFDSLRRTGVGDAMLMDTANGFLVVEPTGSRLGDGEVLSSEEAAWELQPVWYTGPRAKLQQARTLLGLDSGNGLTVS